MQATGRKRVARIEERYERDRSVVMYTKNNSTLLSIQRCLFKNQEEEILSLIND